MDCHDSTKQCATCGLLEPLTNFYDRHTNCKECTKSHHRAERLTLTPEQRENARLWRLEYKRNKRRADGCITRSAITKATQKKKAALALSMALKRIIKQRAPKETSAEVFRRRYRDDPAFRAKQLMRSSLRKSAHKYSWVSVYLGHYARKNTKRSALWNVVGYTAEDLVRHISKQFTKGMTMEHFMRGEIHIDHIIPKSTFDMISIEDVRACHALSNLRPMWAADNLKKSNHVQSLL